MLDARTAEGFRKACRDGDTSAAERILESVDDEPVRHLVEGIGGVGAMVWFLVQRRHLLQLGDEPSLESWLRQQLQQAEPMHLLDVGEALRRAEDGSHDEIVRRLKAHLQFLQPPDPTRWSRKLNTPAQVNFLRACRAGDADRLQAALAADPTVVQAVDHRGHDGLTLLAAGGSSGGAELVPILCDAGIRRRADAVVVAARRGWAEMVEALIARGVPLQRPIDEDAIWAAAAATRDRRIDTARFEQVATMLVAAGGQPDCVDRWGKTAWAIASEAARPVLERLGATPREHGDARYDRHSGCSAVIDALISGRTLGGDAELDLNEAAAVGDAERVMRLLEDVYGLQLVIRAQGTPERPMHLAAYFGNDEVVELLIEYGYSPAEVNKAVADGCHVGPKETWGRTAITVAAARGHAKVVDVLMNNVDYFQGRRARRK